MKNILIILAVLISSTAVAQSSDKPKDGTKHTDKSALEMTKVKKDKNSITPNDRSASANGSLTVENSNKPKPAKNKKRQIPDGSYGTVRTGRPFSEDPNYPYDRDGKLIQGKDVEIIKGSSSKDRSSKMTEESTRKMENTPSNNNKP